MNVKFRPFAPCDLQTVREHLPYIMTETTRGITAINKGTNEPLAFFLVDGWTRVSVTVHMVIINSMVLRHGWFETMANYVFTKCGKDRMYATVSENNNNSLSLCKKFGFVELIRLKDLFAEGVDCIFMEVKRENCRFWQPVALAKAS